jgi:hypothetical protein
MSPLKIASTVFSLISSVTGGSSRTSSSGEQGAGFADTLSLRLASLQGQASNPLLGGLSGNSSLGDAFSMLGASDMRSRLSANGRNFSLFDPESAFRMMSDINNREVNYKAQFAEMSEMKADVAEMQQAGLALGSVGSSESGEAIKARLQTFVAKYNEWVSRFQGTVADGGVLDGTQAAEVSLYELKQSIENRFNGAMHGLHGLRDLGIDINPTTGMVAFDTAKFDAAFSRVKDGVVATINEFSTNFAKSAELLGSANNFIPNRLANLDRVIDYIGDNKSSLQAEFGLGNAATPNAAVSKALAAYNAMFRA